MKTLINFTKSRMTKVLALALVAAIGLSFVGEGNAAGALKEFKVRVVSSTTNQAISGVQAVIVNGPDDGASAITNSLGEATFFLNPSIFNLHLSHPSYHSKDYNAIVLTEDRNFAAQLDILPDTNPTPTPTPNPGLHQFTVSVHQSNAGPAIQGAQVVIVNGPDDGASTFTNSSGVATFYLHSSVFNLHISASGYNSKDYNAIVLTGPSNFSAQLDRVGTTPSPTGCQPTPPSGRPMFNIWPIATSGADCTDYPLLSVKNVTRNTGYTHGSTVNATVGDTLRVQMYVHNGTVDLPQNEAINVMVKANIPSTQGSAVISAEAWANNADRINSGSKGGNTTIAMSSGQTLSYVPGSARLYDRGPSNERGLSDAVVGSGASIGNMRGCFPYLHFVTFEVRVNGPTPIPPTPIPPTPIPPTPIPPTPIPPTPIPPTPIPPTPIPPTPIPPTPIPPTPIPPTPIPPTPIPTVPGTISLTKEVRNVSQNQAGFQSSIGALSGEMVEFRMIVRANGGAVNNVSFTDTLPSRLNYVTGSFKIDGNESGNNLYSVNIGDLSNGQAKIIMLRATVSDPSQFPTGTTVLTNTARVDSSQGSATAQAFVNVSKDTPYPTPIPPYPTPIPPYPTPIPGSAVLSITKQVRNITVNNAFTSQTSATNNDTVQFRIVVQSMGQITANDVRVTDFLPSGLTYIEGSFQTDGSFASGNIFFGGQYFGALYPGQSRTLTFNVRVSSQFQQYLTNTAQASASNAGTVSAQASVSVGTVLGGNINLVLSKRAYNQTRGTDATVVAAQSGDLILYTLRVQNTGNADATGYVFQDNIADVLQLSQLQDFPGASFDLLHNLTWQAITIPANTYVEKTFTVKVNASYPTNTDYVMTNIFGNMVNVSVGRVLGAYTAPATGPEAGIVIALAAATVATVGFRRKEDLLGVIKSLKA